MIALQLFELQGMAAQRRDRIAETLTGGIKPVITGIQLLALRVIDTQIKRIAVALVVIQQAARIQRLEGLQLAVTGQAAHPLFRL